MLTLRQFCSPVVKILNHFSYKVKIAGMATLFIMPTIFGAAIYDEPAMWVLAGLLIVGLSYAAIGFYVSLLETVGMIESGTEKMAEGDLTERFVVRTKDETKRIATSLQVMAESFARTIAESQSLTDELNRSFQTLEHEVNDVKDISANVTKTIERVSVSAAANRLHMKESAASIEGLNSGVQRMADSAVSLAESSMDSAKLAEVGSGLMNDVVSQMNRIYTSVNQANELMSALEHHSREIESMINAIFDIASQTNLLALNAQIEAARAGESGKGFAVVAQEVRKLAEQSGKAAENISHIIEQIQSDMSHSVEFMEEIHGDVKKGLDRVVATNDSLRKILLTSSTVAEEAQEISAITEEMAANSSEVSSAIEEMSSFAEQSAGNARTVSALINKQNERVEHIHESFSNVRSLTDHMVEHIKTFKINH